MSKVAVIGAGAWGTALALQALRAGNDVELVARDAFSASVLKATRANHRLPGVVLPETLSMRHHLPERADLMLWVVPTVHLRSSLLSLRSKGEKIVICAKGIEPETYLLPLEVASDVALDHTFGILTGPNFAHEVAAGLPAAAVVASVDAGFREDVQEILGTHNFRLYGNDDPIGAQLGGAAKNVIAIAAGAVIGAGLGENARAALVTRGLSELCRLVVAFGGQPETVMGLSGLGDLMLTCTGRASRNFSLGYELGCGNQLSDILAKRFGVTEGVSTAAALIERAGNIELPICKAVADLLAGKTTVGQAMLALLSRPQRDE